MNSRPLVIFTCFFLAGVLLAAPLQVAPPIAAAACGLFFLLAVAGYLCAWRNNRWVICLLFLATGFAWARLAYAQINPALFKYCGHYVTIEGVVSREADVRPEVIYYQVNVRSVSVGEEKHPLDVRVLVKAPAPSPVYSYGDLIRAHGLLVSPPEPGNPGAFDYQAYLKRRGIGAILKTDDKKITRLGVAGNPFTRGILQWKEKLLTVSRETLPPDKAALVNGIVFGTQGEIPRETWHLFSQTGIVHILSVSGMHVGLVLAGVLFLFKIFRAPQRWFAPAASAILILYAVLSGMGPAVTRATLMGILFLWAHHLGRDQDWPTTFSGAALVSLLLNPLALYDLGFQLSFAGTWGILYLGPVLNKLTGRFLPRPDWLRAVIWVSLAAQLATLPLVAWHYNIVSPVALLANIVAAPLTGFILALGVAAGLAGTVSLPLAGLLHASTSLALDVFTGLVSLLRTLPGAVFNVPTPSPLLVFGWYLFLCLAVFLSPEKNWGRAKEFFAARHRAVAVVALGVMLAATAAWAASLPAKKEMVLHLIDVGQGDSIFIKTPAGKNILIDAGGWNGEFASGQGAGDRVVVPYLRRLGVNHLDLLVITHPHEDHAGGVRAVAKAFPIHLAVISPFGFRERLTDQNDGRFLLSLLDQDSKLPPEYIQLLLYLTNKKIPVYTACAGDQIKGLGVLEIEVLSPPWPPFKGTRSDENNASVVFSIRYGEKTFLFTGDMEREAQEWLFQSGAVSRADVLKVPHHGSRFFSPAFLEGVQPSLALISAGKNNRFSLPADETLEFLKKHGSSVYRTDEQGAVIISTDGNSLRVKTQRDSGGQKQPALVKASPEN